MKKSELKQLIRECLMESDMARPILPKIKQIMINRLTHAIEYIKSVDTVEELTGLDNSEYDRDKGTLSVTIYSRQVDRHIDR